MSQPSPITFRPQLYPFRQTSLEGINFSGVPQEIETAVSFVLCLMDIIIYGRPVRQMIKKPEARRASEIPELALMRGEATLYIASQEPGFSYPQFPHDMSLYDIKMVLFTPFCDHATVLAEDILKSLIGETWIVCRIGLKVWKKHFFLPRVGFSMPDYNRVKNEDHTVIGIWNPQADPERSYPQYIVDPTILQYREPNSRRFSTWDSYKNFVQPAEPAGSLAVWRYDEQSYEELHMVLDHSSYWVQAKATLKTWTESGYLDNAKLRDHSNQNRLFTEMNLDLPKRAYEDIQTGRTYDV